MKKKMALNDGESKIQGLQRFSFIAAPRWLINAASRAARAVLILSVWKGRWHDHIKIRSETGTSLKKKVMNVNIF